MSSTSSLPSNKASQADSRSQKASSVSQETREIFQKMSDTLLGQVRNMVTEVKEMVSKVEERVEGVEGAVKAIQEAVEEIKNKNVSGVESGEGDAEGDGVTLVSFGKRKRATVSKDGRIVMKELENEDSNLKRRLRECLRKFCLSPAGVFYFQGFKAHFIGPLFSKGLCHFNF